MNTEKTPRTILAMVLLLIAPGLSSAGTAVGIKASSLGIGIELTKSLTEKANVRFGGNFFSYKYSGTEDDVDYDFDLKLRSFTGLLDLHPTGGSFRLSGGFVANSNAIDAAGTSTGTYDIGNGRYTRAQVGTLSAKVDFKKGAPYAGIGFGNAVASGKRVGFIMDLGVVFQGSPQVSMSASGPIASNAQFQNDLRLEQANLQEDLNVFKYYPVFSLGISIKF